MSKKPRYSIVVPIYNESAVLPLFFERLDAVISGVSGGVEVILVNDGSTDASLELILAKQERASGYRCINLSRNFGHQSAITAGLDFACGDAVITMDADLQDPPEIIPDMIAKWLEGYEVVSAKRSKREGESLFKVVSAKYFYRLLKKLSNIEIEEDVGDFRLLDRQVLDVLKSMREQDRFVRGMISWIGFRQTCIVFTRSKRAAGESKYPISKMFRLAENGIIGFSDIPLRIALWLGFLVSLGAFAYGAYVLFGYIVHRELVPGWTSTVLILSFLGGMQIMLIGVVGLYIGKIHLQVKNRPLYVISGK